MATYSQATGYELKIATGTLAITSGDIEIIAPGANEWAWIAGLVTENNGTSNTRYKKFRVTNRAGFVESYVDVFGASITEIEWHDYWQNTAVAGHIASQVILPIDRAIRGGEKMALENLSNSFTAQYKVWYYHFKNNVQI